MGNCLFYRKWVIDLESTLDDTGGEGVVFKGKMYFSRFGTSVSIVNNEHLDYRVTYDVAIKQHNTQHLNEMNILQTLQDCKNVVQYLGYNPKCGLVVTSLCKGGDLHDWFNTLNRPIDEENLCIIMKQIINGMRECHNRNIAHLDLKLENIGLGDDIHNIKILDFGGSTNVTDYNGNSRRYCSTPNYMSPEVARSQVIKSCNLFYVDYWAIGVIMYTLLTGFHPFNDKRYRLDRIKAKIIKGEYKWPGYVSPKYREFVDRLLEPDITKRLNLDISWCEYEWLI
jgi:serine/threonine protein kinase